VDHTNYEKIMKRVCRHSKIPG